MRGTETRWKALKVHEDVHALASRIAELAELPMTTVVERALRAYRRALGEASRYHADPSRLPVEELPVGPVVRPFDALFTTIPDGMPDDRSDRP